MIYIKNNTVRKKDIYTNKSSDKTFSNEYQILIFLVFGWGGVEGYKITFIFSIEGKSISACTQEFPVFVSNT